MPIAKFGLPYIFAGLAAAAAGFAPPLGWAGRALTALGLAFACFCAYFFRDPDRPLPEDPGFLYSPGDGRVLSVEKEGSEDGVTVRVFLSIFDVHVQRLPCSGRIESVRFETGGFVAAMKPDAKRNERSIVRIAPDGRGESVEVEQITGLIARRIRCWVAPGERAVAGMRYGLIQFGSQVALRLPASAEAVVKPGDRVVGGVTPLARWSAAGAGKI